MTGKCCFLLLIWQNPQKFVFTLVLLDLACVWARLSSCRDQLCSQSVFVDVDTLVSKLPPTPGGPPGRDTVHETPGHWSPQDLLAQLVGAMEGFGHRD